MQLTNILRDVREDAVELGRTYLPAEDLRRFGCEDLAAIAAASGDGSGSLNGQRGRGDRPDPLRGRPRRRVV